MQSAENNSIEKQKSSITISRRSSNTMEDRVTEDFYEVKDDTSEACLKTLRKMGVVK